MTYSALQPIRACRVSDPGIGRPLSSRLQAALSCPKNRFSTTFGRLWRFTRLGIPFEAWRPGHAQVGYLDTLPEAAAQGLFFLRPAWPLVVGPPARIIANHFCSFVSCPCFARHDGVLVFFLHLTWSVLISSHLTSPSACFLGPVSRWISAFLATCCQQVIPCLFRLPYG